ncbi:hypothetical protein HMPREF0201_01679 [Cedecea davisae DSM 4568]|uniref:Uncharacterized protein n=1 Tax=Cedecea davisae DSM 4568 TaxID=566551 RepID=S3JXG3_9ENTR|nr:hypothetical protein HMPREF0201_01679 [Cedecea davisae DSM 4568]
MTPAQAAQKNAAPGFIFIFGSNDLAIFFLRINANFSSSGSG